MSAYECIPCTECGEQTIAARPVCSLCEADKGLFAPPPEPARAAVEPLDAAFAKWWTTPSERTGHPPSAILDEYTARTTWAAAHAALTQ